MQPLLTTYDKQELVTSGLYTGEDLKLSVDDVLTAYGKVSERWSKCVRLARQVVADHLREIAVQSIAFLNDNDTYADLTPAEEHIAAGRAVLLLRKLDGMQFADYFAEADSIHSGTTQTGRSHRPLMLSSRPSGGAHTMRPWTI